MAGLAPAPLAEAVVVPAFGGLPEGAVPPALPPLPYAVTSEPVVAASGQVAGRAVGVAEALSPPLAGDVAPAVAVTAPSPPPSPGRMAAAVHFVDTFVATIPDDELSPLPQPVRRSARLASGKGGKGLMVRSPGSLSLSGSASDSAIMVLSPEPQGGRSASSRRSRPQWSFLDDFGSAEHPLL